MNWVAVAKKDFTDARRSKMLWGATAVFLLFIALALLTNSTETGPTRPAPTTTAMSTMVGLGMFFLPLTVLAIAYLSITGERESGRIKYLLGLPTTRLDVVLGKFVSRTAIAVVAALIAYGIGAVIMWFHFGSLPAEQYAKLVLVTLYFTVVSTGIVVGISAMSSTRGRALAGSLGVYFVFNVIWVLPVFNPQQSTAYVVETLLGLNPMPQLYDFVLHLSPAFAYNVTNNGLVIEGLSRGGFVGEYSGGYPVYLQAWFMLVVLLVWLVVPLLVGYWRFRDAELM